MMALVHDANKVIVLDHHKSALEMLVQLQKDFNYENLDLSFATMELSGCGICWNYLNPGKQMPKPLAHIQDRDLWQFNLEDTDAFCEMLQGMPDRDFKIFDKINEENEYQSLVHFGNVLVMARESRVLSSMRRAIPAMSDDDSGPIWTVNATSDISELGNALCKKKLPDGETPLYSQIWFLDGTVVKYCLRSMGDYDVSAIAKKYGGGGHKNAAGYSIETVPVDS
jgi:hypothetical protein